MLPNVPKSIHYGKLFCLFFIYLIFNDWLYFVSKTFVADLFSVTSWLILVFINVIENQ